MAIAIGDQFKLKSGGPVMTVNQVGSATLGNGMPVVLVWFDTEGKFNAIEVAQGTIVRAEAVNPITPTVMPAKPLFDDK